jgi:hypothetical protein
MEDHEWIDFKDCEEPEEHRPMPAGRYEALVKVDPQRVKHLRKEGDDWYWDWGAEDPAERLPFQHSRECILRVRRVGDLYPRS